MSSDPSIAVKPPLEAIHQSKKLEYEQLPVIFSPSISASTQLDTIPIINPTPPTTATPIILPASPPPPLITTLPPPTTTIPSMAPPPPTTTTTTTPTTSGGAWCVASPTASETALQVGLDYACGYGGADCSAIQAGQSCYNPNTIRNHASYAFNDYYQKNPVPTSCVFGGVAQLTYTDPSKIRISTKIPAKHLCPIIFFIFKFLLFRKENQWEVQKHSVFTVLAFVRKQFSHNSTFVFSAKWKQEYITVRQTSR